MSSFVRRFLFDPGNEVLLEIESINILDLEPPASIQGIGTGTVICVGEYENGDFEKPTEIASAGDLATRFGAFGYTYGGVIAQNPCARYRKADGALTKEYWNGNAAIQLTGKRFKRLIVCRVDTSVGTVELRREAFITGNNDFRFNLEPGQILSLDIGAGPVSTTFTATAATVTSAAATYANIGAGDTLTIGYDDRDDVTVTFLAGDTTQAAVLARINLYMGFTFAAAVTGTTHSFTGIQRGAGGQVRVVSGSGAVLTDLGATAAVTLGTGNVQNIDAVSFEEIKAAVESAMSNNVTVRRDSGGRLRVSKDYAAITDYLHVGPATTATNLGFDVDEQGSNDGIANLRSTAQTWNLTQAGAVTFGVDDEPNFAVTFAAGDTQAVAIAAINAAAGFTMATAASATITLLRGRKNGGQVRVVSGPTALLAELGLTTKTVSVPAMVAGKIPAGTRVQTTTQTFVTMQDVIVTAEAVSGVTASGVGPYTVKIRHATDDGTGTSAAAGAIDTTTDAPDLGAFQVVNPNLVSAALNETAIDAKYVTAIEKTNSTSNIAKEANVIYSARQSNTVRRALKTNAIEASKNCFGRIAVIRAPMNTHKDVAKSNLAEPGVGAYRDQRVVYTYPNVNIFVQQIGQRGIAGGEGFTADGNIDTGADGVMASILSQLPPEENPGQATSFTSAFNGLESGENAQDYEMTDYILFKNAGIAAPRVDDGVLLFQSGVTSVDPLTQGQLKNISRRRMADFIQDTLAKRLKNFGKRLSTVLRRRAVKTEIQNWMDELLGKNTPGSQRIAGYELHDRDNTDQTLGAGLYRLTLNVRNLASLDAIVLANTVGENVTVTEVLPEAA